MKRFLHWRKMTWAIALWIGVIVVWGIHAATTSSTVVADCTGDAAVRAGDLSQQECVFQATIGVEFGVLLIGITGLIGLLVLGVLWFTSRPLWRQGYGARLRRLSPTTTPWATSVQNDARWKERFETTSSTQ